MGRRIRDCTVLLADMVGSRMMPRDVRQEVQVRLIASMGELNGLLAGKLLMPAAAYGGDALVVLLRCSADVPEVKLLLRSRLPEVRFRFAESRGEIWVFREGDAAAVSGPAREEAERLLAEKEGGGE